MLRAAVEGELLGVSSAGCVPSQLPPAKTCQVARGELGQLVDLNCRVFPMGIEPRWSINHIHKIATSGRNVPIIDIFSSKCV